MKRRWKYLLVFLAVIIIAPLLGVSYFFLSNEAPILSGEIIYGEEYKPGLDLDIYTPTTRLYEKAPVIIFIHGGAWITGAKESLNVNRFNKAINILREQGYAVVSINYTLATTGNSPFPACIADAADAVSWVNQHADEYNFDLNNVGLFGESAGAHIAMMLAYANPEKFSETYIPTTFNYVVDVYGPNRLEGIFRAPLADTMYAVLKDLPESLKNRLDLGQYLFGFDPRKDSVKAFEMMHIYSPFNFVDSDAPPTLLIQGNVDRVVPIDQSLRLQLKLDSLGVINEMHIVDSADHGFIFATDEQKDSIQHWIVDFIQSHYREQAIIKND